MESFGTHFLILYYYTIIRKLLFEHLTVELSLMLSAFDFSALMPRCYQNQLFSKQSNVIKGKKFYFVIKIGTIHTVSFNSKNHKIWSKQSFFQKFFHLF